MSCCGEGVDWPGRLLGPCTAASGARAELPGLGLLELRAGRRSGCCMPQQLRLQRSEQPVQARSSLALTVLAAAPLGCSNACFLSLHPPILPNPQP